MDRIWLDGKTRKEELAQRLHRVEQILARHRDPPRSLRVRCANHLADALGCLAKCRLDLADRALDAAEETEAAPDPAVRPRTFTVADLNELVRSQRASLEA